MHPERADSAFLVSLFDVVSYPYSLIKLFNHPALSSFDFGSHFVKAGGKKVSAKQSIR